MRRPLLASLALLALPSFAGALTPAAETYLDQGLAALYNLDYDEARSQFRELIRREPQNPFGYLFEAGAIWWQSSNEYGLFKDTPTLEGRFEEDIRKVVDTADRLFDASDRRARAEARFAAGMALGTRGQWHLMRGNWMRAYFDGKKAIKHLNKCAKLDPDYYDVYLGLGVYDYQAARLPGILKLGGLLGVRGDEARGIERIRLALEKGRFGSRQAAQFLLSIYLLDRKDYNAALPLLQRLRQSFPASPYFHFLELTTLFHLGRFDASQDSARELLEKARADPGILGRKQLSLFCGLSGTDCLNAVDVSAAIEWLSRAIDRAAPTQKDWLAMAHLYRGISHDVLGQRSLAVDDYERALSRPDFARTHERARHCLLNPCTRAEVVTMLKGMTAPQAAASAAPLSAGQGAR
ncbi:MAG: tetratricopeptide repeat protein [Elusimicrobia bacterium]|nr:tetratricopeptide repeat protein [Elusimicrobiota bacterium]